MYQSETPASSSTSSFVWIQLENGCCEQLFLIGYVPIILIEPKHIWNTTFRLIILGKLDGTTHPFNIGTCGSNNI
jgi:hypothetical protein